MKFNSKVTTKMSPGRENSSFRSGLFRDADNEIDPSYEANVDFLTSASVSVADDIIHRSRVSLLEKKNSWSGAEFRAACRAG